MVECKDVRSPDQGSWGKIAALMACKPEMAVLRRFNALNILRLLEMQSELVDHEQEYYKLCELDAQTDCPATRSYSTNWEALKASKGLSNTLQGDAWKKGKTALRSYSTDTYLSLMNFENFS